MEDETGLDQVAEGAADAAKNAPDFQDAQEIALNLVDRLQHFIETLLRPWSGVPETRKWRSRCAAGPGSWLISPNWS